MTEKELKDLGIDPSEMDVSEEDMMASMMEGESVGESVHFSESPMEGAAGNGKGDFIINNNALSKVKLDVTVELGRLVLPYVDVENLTRGSVLVLDKKADELLTLSVNDSPIARCSVEKVDGQYTLTVQSLEGYKA